MKIAIVTDSNSGITQNQAKELGVSVIPMPFMINDKTYYEDITLTQEQFYEELKKDANISTSQPSPEEVMNLWSDLLKEYDEIVHIPMSSSLSGSCQTAMMLAEEFDGKVQVVDNQRISVTQYQSVLDAQKMAQKGYTAGEIKKKLEETKADSVIFITVDTLKYLKKGGRITPAAAALGTLLRIKPVLIIEGGKLDAFSKARTAKQAKTTMLSALAKELDVRLGDKDAKHMHLQVAHTANQEIAEELKKELETLYPQAPIHMDSLSLSVACHIGPGAFAVACTKMLDI
ncbi:MAG: DegV family protein [Lachnospiraceae bacterium]